MSHVLIALVFCGAAFLIGLPAWVCLAPAVWYAGREFAQAEFRYIEWYCGGKRANMPWYAPFTPRAWTREGLLDWVVPGAVCLMCAFFSRIIQFS